MMRSIKLLSSLLLLSTVLSCGKSYNYDQPEMPIREQLFDIVWVEPKVVYSDSLFTLIRADRLDSIPVEKLSFTSKQDASFAFTVNQEICFVNINLYDYRGQIVQPLISKNLIYGHYKISLVPRLIDENKKVSRYSFLKGDVCDSRISLKVE